MSLEIRSFPGPLGAEVTGIDLNADIDERAFWRVRGGFLDHGVIVFRDQAALTPARQIAFSKRFGPLQIHVLHQFHLAGHPEVLIVSNVVEDGRPLGLGDAGRYWHSDLSYKAVPSLGSLLHARELPAEGGDTLFANMYRAYATLPPALARAIDGRQAIHSYLKRYDTLREKNGVRPVLSQAQLDQVQEVAHPMVRIHPDTRRKTLFVSEGFTTRIVGLPEDESDDILAKLFAHSTAPDNLYRHRWRPHDLVFWDNRCTVHLAAGCPADQRRTLYRTTVQGDVPH